MIPICLTLRQEFAPLALEYYMLMLEEIFTESLMSQKNVYPGRINLNRNATCLCRVCTIKGKKIDGNVWQAEVGNAKKRF